MRVGVARPGGVLLPDTAADSWFEHRYSAETIMQDRNEPALTFFDTIEVVWVGWVCCVTASLLTDSDDDRFGQSGRIVQNVQV